MLRRLGSKARIADKIISLFPRRIHTFFDLFFGTGAIGWRMIGKVKYIIGNDNDADVANLYLVAKNRSNELYQEVLEMPLHETLFKHWYKHKETDPLKRAVRFLMLSNCAIYGADSSCMKIHIGSNGKTILLRRIKDFCRKIAHVYFISRDFREAFNCISSRKYGEEREYFNRFKERGFVYADPPYLQTTNNYKHGFTRKDTEDLFDILCGSGVRFAVSEFDNPVVLKMAERRGLQVVEIGERRNLGNRRKEVLIVNYPIRRCKPVSLF